LVNCSVTVETSEVVAIVGPSGSGKTTVLSIAGLLLMPDAGDVMIDGVSAGDSQRLRRHLRRERVSWILQTTNVLTGRTVIDNVCLPLYAQGLGKGEALERAVDVLRDVAIAEGMWRSDVALLSGGERQRVCIARALSVRPSVLLADEPTGHLDTATSAAVTDLMVSLAIENGAAVLLATHDTQLAQAADSVLELQFGTLMRTTGTS
jgi:ABC-type lipoprotein export system ATPase subunit